MSQSVALAVTSSSRPNQRRAARVPTRSAGQRSWRIPPAIECEPGEHLPGRFVLDELSGAAALFLWQTQRDVLLWAAADPLTRDELFAPGASTARQELSVKAALPRQLAALFDCLSADLAAPGIARPESIADICLRIARDAESRCFFHTAVSFAQAGAFADSLCPIASHEVGRLALCLSNIQRAESWLSRTIGLARRRRDKRTYASALANLGLAAEVSGRPAIALARFAAATRAAKRARDAGLRARARYGSFRALIALGQLTAAEECLPALRRFRWDQETRNGILLDVVHLYLGADDADRAASVLHSIDEAGLTEDQRLLASSYTAYFAASNRNKAELARVWHELVPSLACSDATPAAVRAADRLAQAMAVSGGTARRREAEAIAHRLAGAPRPRFWCVRDGLARPVAR